jgi:hypothetical protein
MSAHAMISVTTTPQEIAIGGELEPINVTIQNQSDVDVFLGGEGVSPTAFGFKLAKGSAISFDAPEDSTIFVVSTVAASISVLKIGVVR